MFFALFVDGRGWRSSHLSGFDTEMDNATTFGTLANASKHAEKVALNYGVTVSVFQFDGGWIKTASSRVVAVVNPN